MQLRRFLNGLSLSLLCSSGLLHAQEKAQPRPMVWENATIYFILTDRFQNANPGNDDQRPAAPLRNFMGGDLAGITAKIREGYFQKLGVDALWITPPVEQVRAAIDEGSGKTYAYHGYWARDFTRVDAHLGTAEDMRELVDTAHAHGLRILLDVVLNHTGPASKLDPLWPAEWVRNSPVCTYKDVASTVRCKLVASLPDFRTESKQEVRLPAFLQAKWRAEGRLQQEVQELDEFFKRTGLARTPRNHLIKWQVDWVRKYGIDGFRVDTAKHVEPEAWAVLRQYASEAFEEWKRSHPQKTLSDSPFYMTGEVYGYAIEHGLEYRMEGGTGVDFFAHGFDSLINFGFKSDAQQDYESLFSSYANKLQGEMRGRNVLNCIATHDDTQPFDLLRKKPYESATKLLLSPGAAQIYYGDESARPLTYPGTEGDAGLRTTMNWAAQSTAEGQTLLAHWQKLGRFRQAHPAIGAGTHQQISASPYVFARSYAKAGMRDQVIVALDVPAQTELDIPTQGVFAEGERVHDYYSAQDLIVKDGRVRMRVDASVVLLGRK